MISLLTLLLVCLYLFPSQALAAMTTSIRMLSSSDQELIWKMLQHAAHETNVEDVQANPLLQPYAKNFGHERGDLGAVAVADFGGDVGAAWIRSLGTNAFATSHLKDTDDFAELKALPELAIACLPEYRGQGVGSHLLKALLKSAQEHQYPGICLSCQQENPAMRLYERVGFLIVPGTEQTNRVGSTSVTMKFIFEESNNVK